MFSDSTKQQIPNALTLFRIILVPIVCGLLIVAYETGYSWPRLLAGAAFIAAAVTDFFDGYLARRWQVISDFGRLLDPIADKLLVLAVLFMLGGVGDLNIIGLLAGMVIVIREVAVTGLREFLAAREVSVPVTWVAKWKATAQMVALVAVIVGPALAIPGATVLATSLMVIAAVLTFWSGWDYFSKGLKSL